MSPSPHSSDRTRTGSQELFSRFGTKLFLLILFLVVPALALMLVGALHHRRVERTRVRENTIALSELAAAHQLQFVRNTRQLLATLSQLEFLVLTTNAPFCDLQFSNLRKLSPDYLNFGIIDLDGHVFSSAEATNNGIYLGDRSYFEQVMRTKQFSIGEFQVGRLTRQPALNFGFPIKDASDQTIRVLYASLKLSLLSDSIARIRLPEGAVVTVLDRKGNVLARHPDADKWVGASAATNALVQWTLRHQRGVVEMPGLDGVPRLNAVTPIGHEETPGMFVTVGLPIAESFAHADRLLVRSCVAFVLFAGALLAGAWWYSRNHLLRPIHSLVAAARRLGAGELGVRTETSRSCRELSDLAEAFNSMAATLQARQIELKRASENILQINATLEQRVKDRTAELATLNKELEAFSYSVSHDLRAPLRHVDGYIKMLRKHLGERLDEKSARYVETIVDSARQMGQLIDALLAFSRMGRAELQRTRFDLGVLAREVARSVEAEGNGRTIEWTLHPLPEMEGDPVLMRQVLTNLFSNAVKYTRTRDVAKIEFGCRDGSADELVFFVRDNGAGFDMKYSEKLFGIFQRLHHANEFEGTGIGLANVQRIIARHGGRVWAEAELDRGATFYFSLPRTRNV